MPDIEYRAWNPDDVEMRAEGDGMSFSGRAVVYGKPSLPLPFIERIEPGAAKRTLRSRNDIKALFNHDSGKVLGSTRAGTLRLTEDDGGVVADISLPETTIGKDVAYSVARRDITSMSMGFTVVKDAWNADYTERSIIELRLHEVSIVAMPAYPQTTALVRALPRLAYRTGMDVDALTDAIDALEAGADNLTESQLNVLAETVERLRPTPEPTPEPQPDLSALQALSDLLKKRDDL